MEYGLIVNNDGQFLASSRQLAINFGKRHDNVLRDISVLIGSSILSREIFIESTYENRGKLYPEYLMNRDGFTLLAMGFGGARAMEWKLKYIAAFNEMEATISKDKPIQLTRLQILQMAMDAEIKVLELEETIKLQAPQVLLGKAVEDNESCCSVAELAKIIMQNGVPMGQNRLFTWFRENGYTGKRESIDYNMPTQYSMNLQLFAIKYTQVDRTAGPTVAHTLRVTGKGMSYFINKFIKAKQIADELAGQQQLAAMSASEGTVLSTCLVARGLQ